MVIVRSASPPWRSFAWNHGFPMWYNTDTYPSILSPRRRPNNPRTISNVRRKENRTHYIQQAKIKVWYEPSKENFWTNVWCRNLCILWITLIQGWYFYVFSRQDTSSICPSSPPPPSSSLALVIRSNILITIIIITLVVGATRSLMSDEQSTSFSTSHARPEPFNARRTGNYRIRHRKTERRRG